MADLPTGVFYLILIRFIALNSGHLIEAPNLGAWSSVTLWLVRRKWLLQKLFRPGGTKLISQASLALLIAQGAVNDCTSNQGVSDS